MKKATVTLISVMAAGLFLAGAFAALPGTTMAYESATTVSPEPLALEPEPVSDGGFEVEVLVGGRSLEEYRAHGRSYVEALEGAEYELRVRNPLGVRVAVALSVDGLNTIDARRTSAWDASKWVIEPYGTITIRGWQMSSSRARQFYFTTERDSYGAKLGQTSNLGVISAVFYRERQPVVIVRPPRPIYKDDERSESKRRGEEPSSPRERDSSAAAGRTTQPYPRPDDDSAATGIGRNVRHDVTWVNMDLQQRAVADVTIRYEYREALTRLGIFPRRYPREDVLRRRERSTGFEDGRYSPEP